MKIGIFLAYAPQTKLGKEGLGRYLGNLIKGFAEAKQQVLIVTPKWSLNTITALFRDFGIQDDAVTFSVLERPPVFWGILNFFHIFEKKEKKPRRYRILRTGVDLAEQIIGFMIQMTNAICFFALSLLLLLIACILLPVILIGILLFFIALGLRALMRRTKFSAKNVFVRMLNVTKEFSNKKIRVDQYAYSKLTQATVDALVNKANRQNVDIWFVPALFWPETRRLKQVRVIVAPDLVTEEFPFLCADVSGFADSTKKCRATIQDGNYFITYSEYLKNTLLWNRYGKSNVRVIPHALNYLLPSIEIDSKIEKKLNAAINFTDAFASMKLDSLKSHIKYWPDLFAGSSFKNIRYIFYASQARPYKNILNLLRACKELIVNRYVNIKLVLTCDFRMVPGLQDYIVKNCMQPDVITFYNVDNQSLAALYRCAELVVNPTLYEGGFPFTFGEGLSVGTPSIMSDIPQVREVIEPYGIAEEMLFDPNNVKSIADKIEYGLKHKETLYQKQLPIFEDMQKRTSNLVAQEYLDAFKYFKELDEESHV